MKTAKEMKEITIKNNPTANYIENVVAPEIEARALQGEHSFRIETDKVTGCSRMSRSSVCERLCEYLKLFGYATNTLSNFKAVDVVW